MDSEKLGGVIIQQTTYRGQKNTLTICGNYGVTSIKRLKKSTRIILNRSIDIASDSMYRELQWFPLAYIYKLMI